MNQTKRIALVGLSVLLLVSVRASSDDEGILRAQLEKWDAAVWAQDSLVAEGMASDQYTYVEPDSNVAAWGDAKTISVVDRLQLDAGRMDANPLIRIVGDTAIVTGTYRLLDRLPPIDPKSTETTETAKPDKSKKPVKPSRPRFVAQGRYTTTWVREDGVWRLLAEHRSLNDMQGWAIAAGSESESEQGDEPAPTLEPESKRKPLSPAQQRREEAVAAKVHQGFRPSNFTRLIGAYEPTSIGLTWDQGDEPFMDFTLSPMVALFPPSAAAYPEKHRARTGQGFWTDRNRYAAPNLYFAATLRAGQYIETRPSSPVVGKRFNPLLALRWWNVDAAGRKESLHNYFEVVLAHESNGQFISSRSRFDQQLQIYLNQDDDPTPIDAPDIATRPAYLAARDNISRGWDYVGMHFARDWDSELRLPWFGDTPSEVTFGVLAKWHHYVDGGGPQGGKEEYGSYDASGDPAGPLEFDREGKPRGHTDGVSVRFFMDLAPRMPDWEKQWYHFLLLPERRYAATWTTGSERPFAFNTLKLEATATLLNTLPVTVWYRRGYNSDFIDYYRKDESYGLSLNYWEF